MKLQEALEEFLLDGRARMLSQATLNWYDDLLQRACVFLNAKQIAAVEDVRPSHLRLFITDLTADRKPATIAGYFRALRALFNWLAAEGLIESNPMQRLTSPKVPHKLPPSITPQDALRLLHACPEDTLLGKRNYAIIMMLWDTGVRVGELVNLKLGDLHLSEGYVVVNGKGNKEREVPMGKEGIASLRRWLNVRPDGMSSHVFVSTRGNALKRRGVSSMLKNIQKRAGVNGRLYPHLFRHSFARQFLLAGGDPITLQQILGHSSLAMVKQYVRFTAEELVSQHRRSSPGDRLRRIKLPD